MNHPILVTGAAGQVGGALAALRPGAVQALSRHDLDITDRAWVRRVVGEGEFRAVINAAAFTDVDDAEGDPETARAVNSLGPGYLAEACEEADIPLIHISTDYVFDGENGPYDESAPTNPINTYGKTKLEGEQRVQDATRRHLIVRTSSVFARGHSNFVTTIARLVRERTEVAVVTDQRGCPTPAHALADILLRLLDVVERNDGPWGIVHVAGQPAVTRFDLAQAIVEETGAACTLRGVTSGHFPSAARRPSDSSLVCDRLRDDYGIDPPEWRAGLVETVG